MFYCQKPSTPLVPVFVYPEGTAVVNCEVKMPMIAYNITNREKVVLSVQKSAKGKQREEACGTETISETTMLVPKEK